MGFWQLNKVSRGGRLFLGAFACTYKNMGTTTANEGKILSNVPTKFTSVRLVLCIGVFFVWLYYYARRVAKYRVRIGRIAVDRLR